MKSLEWQGFSCCQFFNFIATKSYIKTGFIATKPYRDCDKTLHRLRQNLTWRVLRMVFIATKPYRDGEGLMEEETKKEVITWQSACTDFDKYIVQSNDLITAKQDLSKNATKLIRATIMQIKPADNEIMGVFFTPKELAKLFNVTVQEVYQIIDDVTTEIMSKFISFRVIDGKNKSSFRKVSWTSVCEYIANKGAFVKLNNELRPNLIGLNKFYAQYQYNDIFKMGSPYSIRIYELIIMKLERTYFPKEGRSVVLTVEEITTACGIEGKYTNGGDFKKRVVERAIRDINKYTVFEVSYEPIVQGSGGKIVAFNFIIRMEAIKALFVNKEMNKQKFERMPGSKPVKKNVLELQGDETGDVIQLSFGGRVNEE